jgi:hypothetical protein
MRRLVPIVLAATLAASAAGATSASGHDRDSGGPPDTVVQAWDAVSAQALGAAGLTPAEGYLILGYSAVAQYDAAMAIHRGYEAFAVRDNASRRTSPQAAVLAAGHRILAHYLPAQAPTILTPAYETALAGIAEGAAKTEGVALGTRVADALIALRSDDGFRVPATYTAPNPPAPGVWLPTGPTPIGTYLPGMRPFVLESADQFRPDGPPALNSRRWAREYDEVREIGSVTSTTRTPEQTVAARFWAESPVAQTHAALRRFIADRELDVYQAARFLAMSAVTVADAFIACFDAKYAYAFWRPVTAIRAGDTDGNDATVGDPTWSTLLAGTPNHPEYPSAHSCITPAGGVVAATFLGSSRIDYTVPSLTGLGDRTFKRVKDLTYEVGNARIWGGIHYRSAVEDGVELGLRVAQEVLDDNFRRVHR